MGSKINFLNNLQEEMLEFLNKHFFKLIIFLLVATFLVTKLSSRYQWMAIGIVWLVTFISAFDKLIQRAIKKRMPFWRFLLEISLLCSFTGVYLCGILREVNIIEEIFPMVIWATFLAVSFVANVLVFWKEWKKKYFLS